MYNDRIIGEGWHSKAGEPHAEVNAIASVKDKSLISLSTIYVSLEPCSHFGKTPPCSDLIIASGIKKIVIGTVDPFAKVAGRGIKKLLDAGCEVIVGVLEDQCNKVNRRFFTYHKKNRPFVILKWAQSQDGFLAPHNRVERAPVWITNSVSRQLVHKWRSEEQAILVGTNTAVKDNPKLNTRLWKGHNPMRFVLDQNLRTPLDSALFDGTVKTVFICKNIPKNLSPPSNPERKNLEFAVIDFEKEIAGQICEVAYDQGIQSIIIEGGTQTLQTFINANIWDEARIFTGSINFKRGIKAPAITSPLMEEKFLINDHLKIYSND